MIVGEAGEFYSLCTSRRNLKPYISLGAASDVKKIG
jgi:hypothetical protein